MTISTYRLLLTFIRLAKGMLSAFESWVQYNRPKESGTTTTDGQG